MKHDEALARTMSPAERAILEEWAARDGPLAEACRAALRDLDANRDVVDITAMTDEQLEAVIAESCAAWHGRERGRDEAWRTEFRRGLPGPAGG
jgi:hypothetical protein